MNNLKQQAIQLATEISTIFAERFGYTPIIGGSLSLIINGYTPQRYADQKVLNVGDIDLCLDNKDYYLAMQDSVWSQDMEQSVPNVKCIKTFISSYRVEVYPLLKIDTEDCQWYWLGNCKIANPCLALHAKAEYVLSELGGVSLNEEYQQRRNARIWKHFTDLRFANFADWKLSSKTAFVKNNLSLIVDNYIQQNS